MLFQNKSSFNPDTFIPQMLLPQEKSKRPTVGLLFRLTATLFLAEAVSTATTHQGVGKRRVFKHF